MPTCLYCPSVRHRSHECPQRPGLWAQVERGIPVLDVEPRLGPESGAQGEMFKVRLVPMSLPRPHRPPE